MIQQLTTQKENFFLIRIAIKNDHLVSTSVLTNESGGIVEETFYEPFGGIISGGNVSHFYYEGKDWSSIINEYDFNFRKYNPDLLIFTKPEQEFPDFYDPQQLNRYSFERNNPYKYVDPDGKEAVLIIGLAIGSMMFVDYGLELYHGFREGASFGEYYEAGARRSGEDVGGALLFEPEETVKFLAGLVFKYPSFILTGLESYKEISSGSKSSFLKNQDVKQITTYSNNLFNTPSTNTFNTYFPSINNYGSSNQNNQVSQINTAQKIFNDGGGSGGTCIAPSTKNNGGSSQSNPKIINTINKIVNSVKSFFGRIFR